MPRSGKEQNYFFVRLRHEKKTRSTVETAADPDAAVLAFAKKIGLSDKPEGLTFLCVHQVTTGLEISAHGERTKVTLNVRDVSDEVVSVTRAPFSDLLAEIGTESVTKKLLGASLEFPSGEKAATRAGETHTMGDA